MAAVDHTNSAVMPVGQLAVSAAIAAATHPMTVTKVLIQVGHEPVIPVSSTTIFGSPAHFYPNVFKYMNHIRRTEGIGALYKGLGARLCSGAVAAAVSNHVSFHLGAAMNIKDQEPPKDEETIESFKRLCRESTHESVSRCLGTIASHPFQVICVRAITQIVARETLYNSFFGSIREIYEQDGITGFFAGLIPRLIGEALTIWTVNFLVHLVNRYIIPSDGTVSAKGLRSYNNVLCTMLVTHVTYPFTLVSTIMAVNNSRLAAGNPPHMPSYDSWTQCFSELYSQGEIKRGSSLFYRRYNGPLILRHDGKPVPAPSSF